MARLLKCDLVKHLFYVESRLSLAQLQGDEAILQQWLQGLAEKMIPAPIDQDHSKWKAVVKVLDQLVARNDLWASAFVWAFVWALDHYREPEIRKAAATSLGRLGRADHVVVQALMRTLRDVEPSVRQAAASALGQLPIRDDAQLRPVLVALNRDLHDSDRWGIDVRRTAMASIRQLLDGRPIPGYRWVLLEEQRARRERRARHQKRIVFWLGVSAVTISIALAATWLLTDVDPNSFAVRFLIVLGSIAAFGAAIAQILGRTLRDPWE